MKIYGIKSLFPNPDAIQNGEIIRNWNDTRTNYKSGGKIGKYQKGNILESYANPSSAEAAVAKLALQLVDPTGFSNYPDVYYSGKELVKNPSLENLGQLGLNVFGALPLIGKITMPYKAAKTAKILARIGDANAIVKSSEVAQRVNRAVDTLPELIPGIRNVAERTQDLTSKYITTPVFQRFSSPNKLQRVNQYRIGNGLVDWMNLSNTGSDITQGIKEIQAASK